MTTTHSTFRTASWDEKASSDDSSQPRVACVHATNTFAGIVEGTSTFDAALYYSGEGSGWGTGTYVGFEQVTGTIDGRAGSFVLQHEGEFAGPNVTGRWSVVPGSATGDLAGLRGTGGFTSAHGEPNTAYTLDYSFEPA